MQQRIKNLSGQFVVETAPGKGTTIRLAVYCDGKALEKPMG
jgi:signal transduction histidine kinase